MVINNLFGLLPFFGAMLKSRLRGFGFMPLCHYFFRGLAKQ